MEQLRAIVSGKVQGVSFRYYTIETARRLNLTGWVRNKADGTVEVLAEGEHSNLEDLLLFLNEGSPAARVEQVEFLASCLR